MPLSRTAPRKLSQSVRTGGLTEGSGSILPSLSMRMTLVVPPLAVSMEPISVTVPETVAWTGEENLPSSLAMS